MEPRTHINLSFFDPTSLMQHPSDSTKITAKPEPITSSLNSKLKIDSESIIILFTTSNVPYLILNLNHFLKYSEKKKPKLILDRKSKNHKFLEGEFNK